MLTTVTALFCLMALAAVIGIKGKGTDLVAVLISGCAVLGSMLIVCNFPAENRMANEFRMGFVMITLLAAGYRLQIIRDVEWAKLRASSANSKKSL